MSIKAAPFVGVAVPLNFSPISKAYWQTDTAVKDIAIRFSLKSNKAATKRAGPAKLRGVRCKHCNRDIVVKNRENAVAELSRFGSSRGVECTECYRNTRARRSHDRLNALWQKMTHDHVVKREKKTKTPPSGAKEEFYKSWEWRTVRMEVLKEHGRACQCCGAEPGMKTAAGEPVRICVDHIKPLSKFWHLRLSKENLQVLCDECNQGKGNWDQTDFRPVQGPDEWVIEDGIDPALIHQLTDPTTGRLQ